MRIILKLIGFLLFCFFGTLNAQYLSDDFINAGFNFYLQDNRYDSSVSEIVKSSNNFHYYKYLSAYYIDRDKKGIIDYKYVDQGLNALYPNKSAYGFLCLNLENGIYQNLKTYNPGQQDFEKSQKQLIDFIKYVKKLLPNVKVGFYGLPSNFYWKNIDENYPRKFDAILAELDYISPHLYIHYSKEDYGLDGNINYIKKNLGVALSYGMRLGKPVIPYVWYLIHPSNSKHGRELIDKYEMTIYLETINNYEFHGSSAKGVIWWEPSKLEYKISSASKSVKKSNPTINSIVIDYLKPFSEQK